MRLTLLLLFVFSSSVAEDLPIAMTTLPTSELAAMKTRNDEMWADNYDLVRELQRLNAVLDEQQRKIRSDCGRWIKA